MLRQRRRRNKRDHLDTSADDLFFYLCEHTTKANWRLLDDLKDNRSDVLSVMSFCLLGEITFLAANVLEIQGDIIATIFVALSLLAWAAAFFVSMYVRKLARGIFALPGGNEGITFLANSQDRDNFFTSKAKPVDADEFLSLEYLRRVGVAIPANPAYEEVISAYREAVLESNDLKLFNKNAWLGFLVQVTCAAKKQAEKVEKLFNLVYVLFAINILLLFGAIVICLLH